MQGGEGCWWLHACPFCTHIWTSVPWPLTERGRDGPGRTQAARMPGLSPSPSWHVVSRTKDAPRGGTRNNVSLGEESPSQRTGQHSLVLPSGGTRASPSCVCVHTCVCVCVLLRVRAPLPTHWAPHTRCSWVPRSHTVIPVLGDLNFFLSLPKSGNPTFLCKPTEVLGCLHPSIHLLTLVLLLSFAPQGAGRGRAPELWAFPLSLAMCCLLRQACLEHVCIKWMQAAIP